MHLGSEQVQAVFNRFDIDEDGKVSFMDFKETVGNYLYPQTVPYFRVEKAS